MKALALIICLALSGCVCTYLKTDKYEFERIAVGYNAKLPLITVTPSGTVRLEGYGGEVDPELVSALEKVITELIKKGVIIP